MQDKVYLGDGLYVEHTGRGEFKLIAPRPDGDHEVFLDKMIWDNLQLYIKEKRIFG